VNALTASLAFEHAEDGIRVNAVATGGTEAPQRRIPRNTAKQSEQEAIWYQGIVDQTIASSLMHRYGTVREQVDAIMFLASEEASYITGTVLPVGGGDQG
jgi:dihydroxycyclohexadiene carboxylate dehydrogenase